MSMFLGGIPAFLFGLHGGKKYGKRRIIMENRENIVHTLGSDNTSNQHQEMEPVYDEVDSNVVSVKPNVAYEKIQI